MIKRILVTGISLIFSLAAFSAFVKPEQASLVAKNFYYERAGLNKTIAYASLQPRLAGQRTENGVVVYYAFNLEDKGFVLVSGDDQLVPVLGYSFESSWGTEPLPVQMVDWLENYKEQILYSHDHPGAVVAAIQADWERLSATEPSHLIALNSTSSTVGPLLISTWDQVSPYNDLCPVDAAGPGGKALVGCVATAMAQIMYYYRWPQTGVGSHSYTSSYGQLSANFGNTTYDWSRMLNSLNVPNPAVSTLSYHCGVAVEMNYSPTGSAAYSGDAADAFKTYFRYAQNLQLVSKSSYSDTDWANLMKTQLDARKPLYYDGYGSAGGHAFNLDGYQDGNYFHFNWGWSGSYNGYYYLSNLNPGYTFNNGQGAIIDIFPAGNYPPNCSGSTTYTALRGTIDDGSGPLNYAGNNDCYYLITPQVNAQDSVSNIILRFNRFDTELNHDLVTVYDGPTTTSPILGTFSGSSLPTDITSGGNKVLLHFVSDNANQGNGWFLTYEAKAPVFCHPMDEINSYSGIIEDGSGPKNYQDKVICQWLIHPPHVQSVSLSFDQFSLENGGDYVEVYNYDTLNSTGNLLGKFTGQNLPPVITSTTGALFIIFQTNASVNSQGWKAHFNSQTVGIHENQNPGKLEIFPNPAKDYLDLRYTVDGNSPVEISLFTPSGLEAKTFSFESHSGMVSQHLALNDLAKGVYFLRLRTSQGDAMQKLILQ